MTFALILFAGMYVCLLALPDYRYITALVTACIFVVTGILPVSKVFFAVDWNIILMLSGIMIVVELFIESNMSMRMAEKLLKIVPNVKWAVVALSLFAGVVSAFVDNVATVLMVAPIGLEVCRKLDTNPVPVIISIAVSSNLQGAATLVGDTTSILLGAAANMSFNDFFVFLGKPSICLPTEVGALMTIPILLYIFRKNSDPVHQEVTTVVEDHVPSVLMIGVVLSLIFASQFPDKPSITNGLICMTFAVIGCIYESIRQKSTAFLVEIFKEKFDYQTLLLLAGLFIVIAGITEAGVIDAIAETFVKVGGNSLFGM